MEVIMKNGMQGELNFEEKEGAAVFRHTTSHILAQAVKRLYPDAKLAIGPAIDDGFYYDFDFSSPISSDDFAAIEKEMKKIVKERLKLERFTLPREEALALMKEKKEDYKVTLIEDLPEDAVISFYRQGDFVDLCAGPHLANTGYVKAIKLTSLAGAYWRGNEKIRCSPGFMELPSRIKSSWQLILRGWRRLKRGITENWERNWGCLRLWRRDRDFRSFFPRA